MRMWMVDPKLMCRHHLLGEHVELHMLVGTLKHGKAISGYLKGLVVPNLVVGRHEELVREMTCRGFVHRSPIEAFSCPQAAENISEADNLAELRRRCPACAALTNHPS